MFTKKPSRWLWIGLLGVVAIAGLTFEVWRYDKEDPKVFERIKVGMTLTEVEAILGTGQEVTYDELPPSRLVLLAKVDGVTYRKWTRGSSKKRFFCYAPFKDGILINGPLFEETIP